MKIGRAEIDGGALVVVALLLYLDQDGVMPTFLLSCGLHELGHWAAIEGLGGKVEKIRITCVGAEMRLSERKPLSPSKMVLAALAGPMVNLLLCLIFGVLARWGVGAKYYLFSALNFGLACFNLLPTASLDGGWALRCLLWRSGEETARNVLRVTSWGVAILMLTAGGVLIWQYGVENFTVLLMGVWLLGNAQEEK